MSTTITIIFVILIILFFCGAFDRIIYPGDFKEDNSPNENIYYNKPQQKANFHSEPLTPLVYNEVYVCELKQNLYCALIFNEQGYVGIVDAVEGKITENMKDDIKDSFQDLSLHPIENISAEFGKYEVLNGKIFIYLAPKNDYLDGIESLPYMYFGFEGKVNHNYLILDMNKKWFNQQTAKYEISTLTTNLLFKTT